MKRLCFVLQARMGSNRLPEKMGLSFWNSKTIPDLIIEKLKSNFPQIPIVLATSYNHKNLRLKQIAEFHQIFFFQGSENNVLNRFIKATEKFNFQNIIRICADNPFLDINEMKKLIDAVDNYSDYISFEVNGIPSIKTHFGFWGEYVSLDALKRIESKTDDTLYQEHVTNFIYSHPEMFNIRFLTPNEDVLNSTDIRMTIDTLADFKMLKDIYGELYQIYGNSFGINEIVQFLNTNMEYKVGMAEQIKLNSK